MGTGDGGRGRREREPKYGGEAKRRTRKIKFTYRTIPKRGEKSSNQSISLIWLSKSSFRVLLSKGFFFSPSHTSHFLIFYFFLPFFIIIIVPFFFLFAIISV